MAEIDHIGALTPNAVLADALSDIEEIEYVCLYVSMKDESEKCSYTAWSRCEVRDTAYAIEMIRRTFMRLMDEPDD